jgi:hypothetical protein
MKATLASAPGGSATIRLLQPPPVQGPSASGDNSQQAPHAASAHPSERPRGVGERTEMAADGIGDRWQWRQMAVGDQIRFETRREGAYGGSDSATDAPPPR